MKRSLLLVLCGLAFVLGAHQTEAQQQQKIRVAYVEAARDHIFITDGTKTDTLFHATADFSAKHLADLGTTSDGKSMLIAGVFYFIRATDLQRDSAQIFARIDTPYAANSQAFASLHELARIPFFPATQKILPLGVISHDNNQWYGVWESSANGNEGFTLTHGTMDGNSNNTEVVSLPPGEEIMGDFHMSNLAVSNDGNTMIAVIVDELSNQSGPNRFRLLRYNPGAVSTNKFGQSDFTNSVQGLHPEFFDNTDSAFGMALRITPDNNAELGFTDRKANITFYKFAYDGSNIGLNTPTRTLPRSAIPDSLTFFTGQTPSDNEVNASDKQRANGADVQFSETGDSLLFTTHESNSDNLNSRTHYSQIWMYDFNSGTAKFITNDPLKNERQPIFSYEGIPPVAPPPPGVLTLDQTNVTFPVIDTNHTETKTITVSNTSLLPITLDSVTISGPNKSSFSFTPASSAHSIAAGTSEIYTITFHAGPAPASTFGGMFNVYFRYGLKDSLRQAGLSGSSKIEAGGGSVSLLSASQLNFRIAPNPFAEKVTVSFVSTESGTASITMRDLLGNVVFTSLAQHLTVGESKTYLLDARALNLSTGTYYVTLDLAGKQLVEQVKLVR